MTFAGAAALTALGVALASGFMPSVAPSDVQVAVSFAAASDPGGDGSEATVSRSRSARAVAESVVLHGASTSRRAATAATGASAPSQYVYTRMPAAVCLSADWTDPDADRSCPGGDGLWATPNCPDGETALDPLFRRLVDGSGAPAGEWEQVDNGGCPGAVDVGVVVSVEEFRRLPLVASPPRYQPADGRGLVNMDLIVFTEPAAQTLSTTVLGVPVAVRATPIGFRWDFGDGSEPIVTTDPGAPYPDHTIGHPYSQPGTYPVQLTTTWSGEYQIAGAGPWYPVVGTATTQSDPFVAEVFEARSRLVAGE